MSDKSTRSRTFRYISNGGEYFYSVGINADGTLWNPKGCPEDRLRAAFDKLLAAEHERICSKCLSDQASIRRAIGSECWQGVLHIIEEIRSRNHDAITVLQRPKAFSRLQATKTAT
jgi:hypothetical protein